MKEHFIELFDYTRHFNQKIIQLLQASNTICSEKTLRLFNHIINTHQIWNARILQKDTFEVWQINDSDQFAEIDSNNFKTSIKIIQEFDINTTIRYTNSKGEIFSNTIKDILYHIINHSTYHRAQIATELKQNGMEPINTDYIFFKRTS